MKYVSIPIRFKGMACFHFIEITMSFATVHIQIVLKSYNGHRLRTREMQLTGFLTWSIICDGPDAQKEGWPVLLGTRDGPLGKIEAL